MNLQLLFFVILAIDNLSHAYFMSDNGFNSPYAQLMARYRRLRQEPQMETLQSKIDKDWPADILSLRTSGQVSGIDIDSYGNIHVFRRFNHTWNANSFDRWFRYRSAKSGPIREDAIVVLDKDGRIIRSWGKNIFYMPHGLMIDDKLNTWVTDVALHQVLKFPLGSDKPSLTLGKRLNPGRGKYSFCKPTDVALDSSGNIYVSDGYCNHRIVMYASDGDFIQLWGTGNENFYSGVPHSLAMIKRRNADILCVASREGKMITCYQGMNNDAKRASKSFKVPHNIYAIDSFENTLIGVMFDGQKTTGFTFDTINWEFDGKFDLPDGVLGHDVVASSLTTFYVANINEKSGQKPVLKINLEENSNDFDLKD